MSHNFPRKQDLNGQYEIVGNMFSHLFSNVQGTGF